MLKRAAEGKFLTYLFISSPTGAECEINCSKAHPTNYTDNLERAILRENFSRPLFKSNCELEKNIKKGHILFYRISFWEY